MQPDVAIIAPYPRLGERHGGASGVASYSANLAHSLAAAGLTPVVIAPQEPGEPRTGTDGPVQVHRAFQAGRLSSVPQALAAARGTGAAVVHLQHELFLYGGPASVAGLFLGLARERRRPAVVTMHQVVAPAVVDRHFTGLHRIGLPAPLARAALRTVQRGISRLAGATIVHEPAFARIVGHRARTVPHGIEEALPASPADRARAKGELGVSSGALLVLCFGFLAPYKGLETALDAAVLAGDSVQLVVAGGEHPRLAAQGDPYATTLQQRYGDAARFTGYVDDRQVATWFRAADLALFPYPQPHAASGALALALAHRTPALLSDALADTTQAPAVLRAPTDPVALAATLRQIAADRSRLDELADAVATLAQNRSWLAAAMLHESVYNEVTNAPRPTRRSLRAAQSGRRITAGRLRRRGTRLDRHRAQPGPGGVAEIHEPAADSRDRP